MIKKIVYFILCVIIFSLGGPREEVPAPQFRINYITYRTFLPRVTFDGRNWNPYTSGKGIDIEPSDVSNFKQRLLAANPRFVRTYLKWYQIEPTKGARNWPVGFDTMLNTLINEGRAIPIINVKMAPEWARVDVNKQCSRIKNENIPDFAVFMQAVARKYPQVTYWEIWNEQDDTVGAEDYYGCWGNSSEPYNGGYYYGYVLSKVYPALKAVNPKIKVVYGGLMSAKNSYYEGSIIGGGRFDITNFHRYISIYDTASLVESDYNYLLSINRKYNIDVPILVSETSMLCDQNCDNYFYTKQAQYVVQMENFALRSDHLMGWIWYDLYNSWRNCSLLYSGTQLPKPAYNTFITLPK